MKEVRMRQEMRRRWERDPPVLAHIEVEGPNSVAAKSGLPPRGRLWRAHIVDYFSSLISFHLSHLCPPPTPSSLRRHRTLWRWSSTTSRPGQTTVSLLLKKAEDDIKKPFETSREKTQKKDYYISFLLHELLLVSSLPWQLNGYSMVSCPTCADVHVWKVCIIS